MKTSTIPIVFCAALAFLQARVAVAVAIALVPVGNAGNTADPNTSFLGQFGAVGYNYSIGKYDVTNDQYCEFLNAKAASSDPLALWNSNMSSTAEGGINRTGSGPYVYTVKTGQGSQPVVGVTWYEAIRFSNWLDNGQGTGATESGAYTLLGGTPTPSNSNSITRNAGAKWFLPSENEWYKAAYYDPSLNGGLGGYWAYPNRSNGIAWELSTAAGPNAGNNTANTYDGANGYSLTGNVGTNFNIDYLTNVGAYPDALSAYGTLDQGGDVWQWNEALAGSSHVLRGGAFDFPSSEVSSFNRGPDAQTYMDSDIGFRVASVPEPGSITLVVAAVLVLYCGKRLQNRIADAKAASPPHWQ